MEDHAMSFYNLNLNVFKDLSHEEIVTQLHANPREDTVLCIESLTTNENLQLLIRILPDIPLHFQRLDLGSNPLGQLSSDLLNVLAVNLPKHLLELGLNDCQLEEKTRKELEDFFGRLFHKTHTLELTGNLIMRNAEDVAPLVNSFPRQLKDLTAAGCNFTFPSLLALMKSFNQKKAEETFLNTLDISRNQLGSWPLEKLQYLYQSLPANLQNLSLAEQEEVDSESTNWIIALSSIKLPLLKLNLSNNNLAGKIALLTEHRPKKLSNLDLTYCNLGKNPEELLDNIFALSTGLTHLILDCNNLETALTFEQWNLFVSRVAPTVIKLQFGNCSFKPQEFNRSIYEELKNRLAPMPAAYLLSIASITLGQLLHDWEQQITQEDESAPVIKMY